jgi:hypothetical protein
MFVYSINMTLSPARKAAASNAKYNSQVYSATESEAKRIKEDPPRELTEANDASMETATKLLEKMPEQVKQVSEILSVLINSAHKGESKMLSKFLHLYRTDCTYRKSVRDAALLALFNSGYGFSLYRDAKCTSTIDKLVAVATTSGLIADIVKIISIYNKKPEDPKLGNFSDEPLGGATM